MGEEEDGWESSCRVFSMRLRVFSMRVGTSLVVIPWVEMGGRTEISYDTEMNRVAYL